MSEALIYVFAAVLFVILVKSMGPAGGLLWCGLVLILVLAECTK